MCKKLVFWAAAALLLSSVSGAFAQIGPPGWWSQTIGSQAAPGSATIKGGVYTLIGDGHDIWDNADDFHYLYKQLEGDGSMTARVVTIGAGSNTWAKAGAMIRQNNTGASQHAMTVITANTDGGAGNGASFQQRVTNAGGSTNSDSGSVVAAPYWARIVRTGNSFTGFISPNGTTWTQLGSAVTVTMTDPVLIGLCVTSHATGELRTFTFDNVSWTGNVTDKTPQLKAWQPDPADGKIGADIPLFRWTKGETALSHKVYFGTTPELTEADLKVPQQFHTIYYHSPGLAPGVTYYWRVDEIEAGGTIHIGDVWSVTGTPLAAYAPQPADGATGLLPGLILDWMPGTMTMSHQVYFGMDQAAVAAGDTSVDQGTVIATEFNTGELRASTTYYWRIDEVKKDTVEAGQVWSFSTIDAGPANKILYETWQNIGGVTIPDLTGSPDYPNNPTTSEYIDLFQSPVDWADNYGQRLMGWLKPPETGDYTFWIAGDDAQELLLSTDASPASAVMIANVPGWTPAFDWDNTGGGAGGASQMSAPIPLQAGEKYFIMALGKEGGGGDSTAVAWKGPGIAAREVIKGEYVDMFALPPLQAFGPYPANGEVDTPQVLILDWNAGENAQQHEVYFGDDADAVAAADTSSPLFMGRQAGTTFDAGSLEWGKTYSWRIDEISGAEVIKGPVWSFTTANFIPVDNFEGYTDDMDAGEAIWQTWIDGLTNGTGSIVGYFDPPFAEQAIVHGGSQSMPFDYNNIVSPYYSEVEMPLSPAQNWTVEGVTDLSLWVRGYPAPVSVDVTETAGKMTLTGAGADIWNNSDEFTYAFKTLNGNGSIVARVVSIGAGTNTWAKGGVMIRDSLDGGSTHAMTVLTANTDGAAGNGASFQYRLLANGVSVNSDSVTVIAPPYWVKIERMGDALSGYLSLDGKSWTLQGSTQFITMSTPVYIGLCVTSHAVGEDRTFVFDSIQTSGAVSGAWQGAIISAPRHNAPQNLYVFVEEGTRKSARVTNPDLVNSVDWVEWKIPLSNLTGVNLAKVSKLYIGVGDRDNPTPDGAGLVFIDDIRVSKPEPEPAE